MQSFKKALAATFLNPFNAEGLFAANDACSLSLKDHFFSAWGMFLNFDLEKQVTLQVCFWKVPLCLTFL